jgi:hypothetical protein
MRAWPSLFAAAFAAQPASAADPSGVPVVSDAPLSAAAQPTNGDVRVVQIISMPIPAKAN